MVAGRVTSETTSSGRAVSRLAFFALEYLLLHRECLLSWRLHNPCLPLHVFYLGKRMVVGVCERGI
jgi:hypothetical protein